MQSDLHYLQLAKKPRVVTGHEDWVWNTEFQENVLNGRRDRAHKIVFFVWSSLDHWTIANILSTFMVYTGVVLGTDFQESPLNEAEIK